jgi:hypothetical protein
MPRRSVVTAEIEPDYFQFYARRAGAAWVSDQTTDAGYEAHMWSNGEFLHDRDRPQVRDDGGGRRGMGYAARPR